MQMEMQLLDAVNVPEILFVKAGCVFPQASLALHCTSPPVEC